MNSTVTILPQSHDHVIFMRLSGMISGDDYAHFVNGKLTEVVDQYGMYDILIHFDSFQGWTEEGARVSFKSISTHADKNRYIAYVNAPEEMHLLLKIAAPLIKGEARFFEEKEIDKATAWINSHPL
jgi:hypothetical protein